MIQQIQPQTNFPITRLLPDLGDGVTYYLQAIVRNAATGVSYATLNMASQGNRLYYTNWYTIVDPTGRGTFVTITVSVYTDSGHTTKSSNYSDEADTFVVYDQFHQLQGLATQLSALLGEGNNVDYKKIKNIVKTVVEDNKVKIEPPKDYEPHFNTLLDGVKQAIAGIEIPEPKDYEPTDISPVIEHIQGAESRLHSRFDAIKEPDPVDLGPVISKFDEMNLGELTEKISTSVEALTEISTKLQDGLPGAADQLKSLVSDFKDFLYATVERTKQQAQDPITVPKKKVSISGSPRKNYEE